MPDDFSSRPGSFLSAALVALLATGLAGPPAARAAKPAAKLGTVRQQVHRAKAELQKQVTLGDYHASAYHPTAIVERIHALESADAWGELCAAFEELPDDELELFEDEIHKPDHSTRRTWRRRGAASTARSTSWSSSAPMSAPALTSSGSRPST